MKVSELIEKLKELPNDTEIVVLNNKKDTYPTYNKNFNLTKIELFENSYLRLVDNQMFLKPKREKIINAIKLE